MQIKVFAEVVDGELSHDGDGEGAGVEADGFFDGMVEEGVGVEDGMTGDGIYEYARYDRQRCVIGGVVA